MSNKPAPPDQLQRQQALQPAQSILVQAPAGSGKTDLLTRRFLRLLSQVEEPGQVVAITFTNAAAAEMRHRILAELEKASASPDPVDADEFSMDALARRALERSRLGGWKLLDLPAQLRISTIDSFCRDLAVQQPLLSGLGGGLDIAEQPAELYRQAARSTLRKIDTAGSDLSEAIEALLLWRDNGWQEMEDLLVKMLGERDRWMHEFVLGREQDPDALRERLERPFANAVQAAIARLDQLFFQAPGEQEELLSLARFACEQSGGDLHRDLAERAEFPSASDPDALEAWLGAAALLLTGDGAFRKAVDKRLGFPADRKREKARLLELIASLAQVPGLETTLAAVRSLPPAHYPEDDWQIVRACFTLLRHAAAELQVVFAEAGAVDFAEVSQIAQRVLRGPDGLPTDAALAVSDGIHHLLVDEFQDTSRRQHQLLASLVAAWPERTGRTCFAVGDPMQSIYFFRDADAELFPRVKTVGLEIPNDEPLRFDFVPLQANFRTAPSLVQRLNTIFAQVFAADDGSGVSFSAAQPMRDETSAPQPSFALHLDFVPQTARGKAADPDAAALKDAARAAQTDEIVALIRSHLDRMEATRLARANGEDAKYRVAVLGRARSALAPIAQGLRDAGIPFRALDLEKLQDRPEVLDALALARALLNPQDRVAWLGVLRAPWCGLALSDIHLLASDDDPTLRDRPVPDLLAERLPQLSAEGTPAAARVLDALASVPALRASQPTASLGTWLQQVWLRLGGGACVDATARANLDLLWSCLDHLPAGEQDLLGPGLTAALDKLTAQPDPAASAECGVQLMTIHKSKGLEFEVVIVPELQARGGNGGRKMLSWLERGLAHPDETGEITEFLIAPLQSKGADRGRAKEWVDGVYRQRESQEDRRILYVAATRAREELHFFARPACKADSKGELVLAEPTGSLLATAWPALEEEVRARFEQWKADRAASQSEENVVESIAASGQSNLLVMPAPAKPTILRRLPQNYTPVAIAIPESDAAQTLGALSIPHLFAEWVGNQSSQLTGLSSEAASTTLYARHQGGLLSRVLGTAVHSLLEELSRQRIHLDWDAARAALQPFEPRIAAQIRAVGVDPAQSAGIAAKAMSQALDASRDPNGQWILSPHPQAQSEARWAGVVAGSLRTVQVDRVFRAGLTPLSEGEQAWWIVDYKTAHADNLDPAAALPELRKLFAPQLAAYAQMLRNLHGQDAVLRAGLYYPRMLQFDTWEL
ncbi:MAG: UvrD-helicase domain-containing protein [Terracidiphilus sp.]|nr:UvrD-helicase domain-containing protein [Terracidiphilus sp.]MDR3775638.1 UvrD-helicase domain-containing protein [Terracidiphilus sp.]